MLLRFFLSVFFLAAYIFLCPLLNSQLEARWGLEKDANIEYLTDDAIYTVEKTGKWTMESEVQMKILNEAGRQALSVITLTYDATRSTLKVRGAKTITNGKEFVVLKEKIEDKPLASDPLGLRNDHQILIPLEQVAVGSIIYLKLKEHIFKPDMEKYFNHSVNFAQGYLWRNVNVTFKSELPLLFKVNDPKNSLDISQKKEGSYEVLNVKLKKPLFQSLVAESADAFLDPETETYVSVSTEKDYQRIGKHEGKQYKPILTADLPKVFEDIRNTASKIKNETECIDTIVSQLIKKVNYLGNWNSAEGHFIPRTLEAIVTTGYGDCKDYSVSLAAILNALGYQARVAVVYRGDVYVKGKSLPGLNQFNHAIVKAVSPSGKTYWIDPTNITTMADGIYPDIADRPALVLDPENPTYERIPPIDYRHAKFSWEEVTSIKDEGYVVTNGLMCTQGESGKGYTEALTMHPHSVVKEFMVKDFCNSGDPINATLNLPELTSPKIQPLEVSYSYEEENTMLLTNHGYAFPLKSTWHKPYVATSQKHEGAIYVGHPETLIGKKFFKNVKAEDIKSLEFSLQTPWLNAKREIIASDDGVTVIETVEKLKSVISAKELKSPQFQKLRNTLRKYCDGVAIILFQPKVDQKVAQKK